MQLAYATSFNWKDICNWSGLGVYYAKMLHEAGFTDLACLNVNERHLVTRTVDFFKTQIASPLFGKTPSPIFSIKQSIQFANTIESRIGSATHILSPNTSILAHLKKDLKTILYTDATLANLLNFYSNYYHLPSSEVLEAQQIEQFAIDGADLLLYTSKWAADSAVNVYNADKDKVHIIPFGANLQFIPDDKELHSIVTKRDISRHVNLLFIAVDWERKGGEYAIQVVDKLHRMGISATLHVAGAKNIPKKLNKNRVIDHGFIAKCNADEELRLCKLLAASDFLILPSIADCTPVVFSEANAFGIPCLATNVGGHSSIIHDDINGRTWNRENFVESCARHIADLVIEQDNYQQLCFSSRNVYQTESNWKAIGSRISKLVHSI